MLLGGFQKLTLIDFPGKVAATIFTSGCNFRCPYCYNSELVVPNKIKNQPRIKEADLFSFLKERKNFLEGVCISGGEPTIHSDLPDFLKKIKKLGYLVKLDTNGSRPEILRKLFKKKLIDYIAMDVKSPLEKYKTIVGCDDTESIKKSIKLIRDSGVDCEFRTTVIPSLLAENDIIAVGCLLQGSKRYFIQQFRPEKTLDAKFLSEKPYSAEELNKILNSIKKYFEKCELRNF